MAKAPLVSVIVPIYNLETYVAQGVNSLLTQTYSNLQLILVDDASEDRSAQLIKTFAAKDRRITPILFTHNRGVSAARNAGLDLARGELVAFMDGDDWYEPDYIAHAVEKMIAGHYDLITMPFYRDDPLPIAPRALTKPCEFSRRQFIQKMLHPIGYVRGYLWNKVYRRDVIERLKLRFDEQMAIMEDELFTTTYVMATNRFGYTGYPTYHHVIRQNSATHSLGVIGAIPQQLHALRRIHAVIKAARQTTDNIDEMTKVDREGYFERTTADSLSTETTGKSEAEHGNDAP